MPENQVNPHKEFTPDEFKGSVNLLKRVIFETLNKPEVMLTTSALLEHLMVAHRMPTGEAVKVFTNMHSQAFRELADIVEEGAVEFLHRTKF